MRQPFRILASVLIGFISAGAFAAPIAHMTLTGELQGEIQGDSEYAYTPGTIDIYGYSFNIAANPDEHCRPTGQRHHYPFTIVKELDRATPAILRAFKTNETLQVTIDFYRANAEGSMVNYYSIVLKGTHITGLQQIDNRQYDNANTQVLEKIGLTYGEMTEIWHLTKDEAAVVWSAECTEFLAGDLNLDGVVNLSDFVLLADGWLMATH